MVNQNDTAIQLFNFESKQVRVFMVEQEPWWVAKDVCDVLGLTNSRVALMPLDENEKGIRKVYTNGGMQNMAVINESGLYALIMRSNKPSTKRFRKWATSEALPQIRRTGGYIPISEGDDDKAILSKAFDILKKTVEEQNSRIEELTPKAEFYDAVANSEELTDMNTVAKLIGVGQQKLFVLLREKKILMKSDVAWNKPYQKYIDNGYFAVKENRFYGRMGDLHIQFKPLVSQRGLNFIMRHLSDGE